MLVVLSLQRTIVDATQQNQPPQAPIVRIEMENETAGIYLTETWEHKKTNGNKVTVLVRTCFQDSDHPDETLEQFNQRHEDDVAAMEKLRPRNCE